MSAHGMKYALKAVCNGCGASRPGASFTVPTCAGDVVASLCLDCLKAGVRMCSNPKAAPLAATSLLLLAASLPALDLTEPDKQSHLVLGAASSAVSLLILDRLDPDASWQKRALVGIASAAVVGAAKELADSRDPARHDCDRDDFYATTIGGAAVSLVFCWRIK